MWFFSSLPCQQASLDCVQLCLVQEGLTHMSGASAGMAGDSLLLVCHPPAGQLRPLSMMAEVFPGIRVDNFQSVRTFQTSIYVIFAIVPFSKSLGHECGRGLPRDVGTGRRHEWRSSMTQSITQSGR